MRNREKKIINEEAQKELVEKIIINPTFAQSTIYPRLLRYLLDCAIRGYMPKESDIALYVFDREEFDASTDPLIRVHVSKLRKKLESYFKTDGKREDVKIILPARQYTIEFIQSMQKHKKLFNTSLIKSVLLSTLIIFFLIVLYILYSNKTIINQIYQSKNLAGDPLIWTDFLHSQLPTMYVIGNVHIYCEYREDIKNYLIVNNPLINDQKSLEDYINDVKIPAHYIWQPVYEVLPKSALLNFSRIQWLFRSSEKMVRATIQCSRLDIPVLL
jgi:hypothetical protein